ncbi:hypothetical protein IWQ57_001413 [Coemansia nantahalensis]|uniref:Uncharacterized protein n=1 Tax=Coemansia nantahalensis TaxID=2789366 RepID=A0ACC1K4P3_9FUNG|nr:hypothetical protein IWQ57_001413 [Coemansia nantahalensis]
MMHVDMGEHAPRAAGSWLITGDTQFMFQFYKPCFQFYAPGPQTLECMAAARLRRSLVAALGGCPQLLGRFRIHSDRSVSVEYDPARINSPTLEFQSAQVAYADLAADGFSYAVARQHGLDIPIQDGTIRAAAPDQPMLMVKVAYLADGGVALFAMTNHVAFDGNAMFSFIAHWARCNQALAHGAHVELPEELRSYAAAQVTTTGNAPDKGPVEISVDASRTPEEIGRSITRAVAPGDVRAHVFRISVAALATLRKRVEDSGVLAAGEWVSTNSVLTAFVAQCVAQANTDGCVYETGDWTVFQSLDMRRRLGLAERGLGSPLILAECTVGHDEIMDADQLPLLTRRVRRTADRYSGAYLQQAMEWMAASYRRLAEGDVAEPWRHFWFTALDTNRRAVGVSCMNRIPIYRADFGAGRPAMARSFNPRPNYVIVFPGPPPAYGDAEYDELHLYVTLEQPAMDALCANPAWAAVCSLVSAH